MYYASHILIKKWFEIGHALYGKTSQRAVAGSIEEIVILIHESVAVLRSDHCDVVGICFRVLIVIIQVLSPDSVGHER